MAAFPVALGFSFALAQACSSPPEPAPPPDPCIAIYREYDAARSRGACARNDECVDVSGLAPPPGVDDDGRARTLDGRPCGNAALREAAPDVERAVERFRAQGCGQISPPGSTACTEFSHGPHPSCVAGRCVLAL